MPFPCQVSTKSWTTVVAIKWSPPLNIPVTGFFLRKRCNWAHNSLHSWIRGKMGSQLNGLSRHLQQKEHLWLNIPVTGFFLRKRCNWAHNSLHSWIRGKMGSQLNGLSRHLQQKEHLWHCSFFHGTHTFQLFSIFLVLIITLWECSGKMHRPRECWVLVPALQQTR